MTNRPGWLWFAQRTTAGRERRRQTLTPTLSQRERGRSRRGSATIDYFLLICIVLPLATFLMWIAPRAIQSVYDLLTVVVAWPFM